jgi:hypothetical protein
MVAAADLITGRDALHRLDTLTAGAREEFDAAARGADGHSRRRADLARLKAEGFRELAAMRLDVIKAGADESLTAAEKEATRLLVDHDKFLATIDGEVAKAAAVLADVEARRRAAEGDSDAALAAYDQLTADVEKQLENDPAYQALHARFENAKSVTARSVQKLELAKTDREAKSKPYETDPLFSYLWQRKFRTPEYRGRGLGRMLDNWVAKLCRYDEAYLNYARLTELPDRIAEHLANMKLEEAEAEAAIERFEAAKLEEKGAGKLAAALDEAKAKLTALDEELAGAEKAHAELRRQQERAASGDAGPQEQARSVIEAALAKASFPDLKVLAAETTTTDDDRIVDALIKLRTEELQMEVNWRNVEAMPARRRAAADTLEQVRRRFKESGLDSPYVLVLRGAFEAALEAYGRGPAPDGERLWRAILATVRQAPMQDDSYFGGRRRRERIGLPESVVGGIAGAIINEVIREAMRGGGRGRWGGGGWGGGWGGGSGGGSGGGFGGGGFKSGGGFGGGGFKTGGKF